ncbi:hypothetical protein SteCoe_17366 [Stentor coeruleus]|uniref:Uncharacterized protein n=1 Tax=Stentor coeruleus TaxID=5963 RepID=A0A1R2BZ57_9CILI|nr:hypothetical protein SteCoe_17366 [Stentor coeruleus]
MAEVPEDSKKRKRGEDMSKELIEHNSKLASYIHKLEFMLIETTKKYYKSKVMFKNYIGKLVEGLDKAGYTVPMLPLKRMESEDNIDLDNLLKEIEQNRKVQEEMESKKKKMGRPKKEIKTEN